MVHRWIADAMLVPVMRVVYVRVLVLHLFVMVFMLVAFGEMQPDAERHQCGSREKQCCRPLPERDERYGRADEEGMETSFIHARLRSDHRLKPSYAASHHGGCRPRPSRAELLIGPDAEKTTFEDMVTMLLNNYKLNGRRSVKRVETALVHLREFFTRR